MTDENNKAKCILCGRPAMRGRRFCPVCHGAILASRSGEADDTEDLDINEFQKDQKFYLNEAGMPLVYIPPGEFIMGAKYGTDLEKPMHYVYLDAYYIGRFPVTNRQYHEFATATKSDLPPYMQQPGYNDPEQPVVGVSWHDATKFCEWCSARTEKEYFLPTEAQWEKAARGIEGFRYPWGDDKPTPERANYHEGTAVGPPSEVTSHPDGASPFGCQDMAGNAWEWVSDAFNGRPYDTSRYENPPPLADSDKRMLRGGGRAGKGDFLRITRRVGADPGTRARQTGFRIAREVAESEVQPGSMKVRYEARSIVKQAKQAISENRRRQATTLLIKALKLNPDNRAAIDLLKGMPELPEGLEPAKDAKYHAGTGLPLEAICTVTGAIMVLVPVGKFQMGSDRGAQDEKPAHEVLLDSFYMDKYEVTNEMFANFLEKTGHKESKDSAVLFESHPHGVVWRGGRWIPAPRLRKHPAVCVTWQGALEYAQWAGLDLPTEAQWEKAAKGTDGRFFPWGNEFSSAKCNCKQSGIMHTTPVHQYKDGISPYGCWDMSGNVWEWCYDWYAPDYYAQCPDSEPLGPVDGEMKVLRSGGWGADAAAIRCSARYYAPPEIHIETLGGFRCVKLLNPRPVRKVTEKRTRRLVKKITTALKRPSSRRKDKPAK